MTYLWTQEPFVSGVPETVVEHSLREEKGEIDEAAVFKMSNEKYLFIKFSGVKEKLHLGITFIEERDTLQEIKDVYSEYVWW
jgi:hypothetical protein